MHDDRGILHIPRTVLALNLSHKDILPYSGTPGLFGSSEYRYHKLSPVASRIWIEFAMREEAMGGLTQHLLVDLRHATDPQNLLVSNILIWVRGFKELTSREILLTSEQNALGRHRRRRWLWLWNDDIVGENTVDVWRWF